MTQRAMFHRPRLSVLRTRAAVLAAGLGASTVLGAGVAFAAEAKADPATALSAQADAQAKAAGGEKVKKAKAKKAKSWNNPLDKYKLSATYGKAGNLWSSAHSGQDFAVPVGTPVKAAGSGTVVKAGPNGGGDGPAYGNAIVVKHANGKYSQYAHLSKINVNVGSTVKTGQTIAKSGNTGNSSGPHLHFEIRTTPNYGSALNPMSFLRSAGVSL